jgi:hypothetical protein
VQFEKDDDANFHMDLIAGLANMRARNYSLQEVDKLQAKLIAGGQAGAMGLPLPWGISRACGPLRAASAAASQAP